MTTTVFRKNKKVAQIASDSRVSWVDKDTNLPIRWFDSEDFLKTVQIDNVMYGFAGTNIMYKMFLDLYTSLEDSISLLDTLVEFAKLNGVQFFIIRYDSQLRLFAYSPAVPEQGEPEIYRFSKDPIINKDIYAIGSGKYSKEYRKHRFNSNAQAPIRKIISANNTGFKKARVEDLIKKVVKDNLTPDESREAYLACRVKGGDLFTGGRVNMSKNADKDFLKKQVQIMDKMDLRAKANNAVCASPVKASLEVEQLNRIGQYSVSPKRVNISDNQRELLSKMQLIFNAST